MKISDIADIINVTEKDPSNSGIDVFVGLEHYDIAEPVIRRYGSTKMLTTATKKFEAGDVLIARRNVYLQRASVARFSGLTSGDSIILRVKKNLCSKNTDYDAMCQLLPFILNSTKFWDYANTNADGTMSKRLSPAILQEYEFELPSIEDQKVLAEKLWAAYEVKQSYLKMIEATEEMVKSQFIEMFGKVDSDRLLLSDIADVSSGLTKNSQRVSFELKMPYLRVANVFYNKLELDDIQEIGVRPQEIEKTKLQENDLLFVEGNGSPQEIGRVAIWDGSINPILHQNHIIKARLKISSFSPAFLMYFFMYGQGRSQIVRKAASSSGLYTLSLNKIASLQVPAVELEFQQQFVSIAHQADKSISELRKSIDAIDKVIKSLINENL